MIFSCYNDSVTYSGETMKKIVIMLMIFIVSSTITHAFYAEIFEQRSTGSKLLELGFRITQINRVVIDEDIAEAYFELQQSINRMPHEVPFGFYNTTIESTIHNDTLKVYAFTPENITHDTVIIYIHGGSYVSTASWIHFQFVDRLSHKTQALVLLPIYPLAPEYTHKDAFSQLNAWYQDIIKTHADKNIIIMGDSAGGGLALGFTQMLALNNAHLPNQVLLIAPWLDIRLNNDDIQQVQKFDPMLNQSAAEFLGDAWRGDTDSLYYQVSPIFGSFEGLPPIHIFVGTYDILYPDVMRLKSMHPDKDITYHISEKMIHVYPLFPAMRESRDTFNTIVDLIKKP